MRNRPESHPRTLALCLALTAAMAAPATAQDIFGSVQSSDGRPLAYAEIEACKAGDPDACESTITDGRGRYTIVGLSLGAYLVSVKGDGDARRRVTLRDSIRVDLRLD